MDENQNRMIMTNRILCLLTLLMCLGSSAFGQNDNSKGIKKLEVSVNDYIPLLTRSGYEAFPFDISSLTDGKYFLNVKIKEYKDGVEVCDNILGDYSYFPNMMLLSEFPEDSQASITSDKMADPERGIYTMAKKMMIGFTPVVNDSIKPLVIEIENIGGRDVSLPMLPQFENNDSVNGKKLYVYQARPFESGAFATGQFIPLVLFGSIWYDEKYGIHRFCGESEINPDMSSEILKYIPHYYIIGVEVNPIQML